MACIARFVMPSDIFAAVVWWLARTRPPAARRLGWCRCCTSTPKMTTTCLQRWAGPGAFRDASKVMDLLGARDRGQVGEAGWLWPHPRWC